MIINMLHTQNKAKFFSSIKYISNLFPRSRRLLVHFLNLFIYLYLIYIS